MNDLLYLCLTHHVRVCFCNFLPKITAMAPLVAANLSSVPAHIVAPLGRRAGVPWDFFGVTYQDKN
jgi:hypothetical protein